MILLNNHINYKFITNVNLISILISFMNIGLIDKVVSMKNDLLLMLVDDRLENRNQWLQKFNDIQEGNKDYLENLSNYVSMFDVIALANMVDVSIEYYFFSLLNFNSHSNFRSIIIYSVKNKIFSRYWYLPVAV